MLEIPMAVQYTEGQIIVELKNIIRCTFLTNLFVYITILVTYCNKYSTVSHILNQAQLFLRHFNIKRLVLRVHLKIFDVSD